MGLTHLVRRGAVYMVRFRLPADLAAALGMAELKRSLHTRDYGLGRRKCLEATVWFRSEVERLRRMSKPTRGELEEAARRYFATLAEELDRPRRFTEDFMDLEVAYQVEACRDAISALDDQLISKTFTGQTPGWAGEMLAGVRIGGQDLDDRTRHMALQLAARAQREALELLIHQLTTPVRPREPVDDLFATSPASHNAAIPTPARAIPDQPPLVGETLHQAVTEYLAMKERGVGQSQHTELARGLARLEEAIGGETPLGAVDKKVLRGFRDDLQRIDKRLQGRALPFQQRLTNVETHQIASVTAQRYLSALKAFFAWSVAEGLIQADPSDGLEIAARKGETRRTPRPFSKEELVRLFQTPLYAGYRSSKRFMAPGPCQARDGHWWSAILALHTGLRAGELTQLLPGDFAFDAEVPHLKVRQEDDAGVRSKRVKSAASVRDIPFHPSLLELGLREFVEASAKRYPKDRVFRVFRTGVGDRRSDGITKFWRRYLQEFELHAPGRATHLFRHTVADNLRAAGASDEDIGAVLGHSGRTITAGYGGPQPLKRRAATLARLDYGFDVVIALGGPYDPSRHG